MISNYIRDGNVYSQEELRNILKCEEDEIKPLLHMLMDYNVIKIDRNTSSKKEFSILADNQFDTKNKDYLTASTRYTFSYVGIIVVSKIILKCYPKYLLSNPKPEEHLHKVLMVLKKYNKSKAQFLHMFSDYEKQSPYDAFSLYIFLLTDYYDNNVYSNTTEIIEYNGNGEISWEKTINDSIPFISNNNYYYLNLQTRTKHNDDADYFKRLHECILTSISNDLIASDLLELLDLIEVNLSDESLHDFGENDYILYRLENELNRQFNSRKQLVLKALYTYVKMSGSIKASDSFSLFGTTRFEYVWQDVCSQMMNNQYDKFLTSEEMPKPIDKEYADLDKLKDVIEKPFWSEAKQRADGTFELDLISIYNNHFFISDAKYCVPELSPDKPLAGQPGIKDITKQYFYQLAFKKFVEKHHLNFAGNFFLIPTEASDFIPKGTVSLDMLSELDLQKIQVIFVPADKAYDFYLSNDNINLQQFLEIAQKSLS